MSYLWGFNQFQTNHDLELSVAKTDGRVKDLELRCAELEQQLSSLRFFVQALVDLSWEKLDLTDEQLQSRIEELKEEKKREEAEEAARKESEKAQRRGKPKDIVFACPHCGQPVSSKCKVCFYCGKPASPPQAQEETK